MSTLFIYSKGKEIKVLSLDNAKHDDLTKKGWKHTNTLDPCIFLEHLHNDAEPEDIIAEIRELSN